uniref:Uncharacterized protein n=1 Tax=Opuntia streptacantha TaxID=393608 RepID=A0A7C9EGR5_OPUST
MYSLYSKLPLASLLATYLHHISHTEAPPSHPMPPHIKAEHQQEHWNLNNNNLHSWRTYLQNKPLFQTCTLLQALLEEQFANLETKFPSSLSDETHAIKAFYFSYQQTF